MPNFKYTARTRTGESERGFLEAKSEDELVDILQSRGLIVISFESAARTHTKKGKRRRFHKNVRLDDLIIFARQLTTLIDAGITLLRSLEITNVQITSRPLYIAAEQIKGDIAAGSSLRDAIAKHPKIFSKLWVNVIESGETSGQLGFALEQLTQYLEATAGFKRKIITALMYPAVIICVAIAAILVFIIRIIPIFANLYSSAGAQLPIFTQIIFNIAAVIKKGFLFGVIALVIIIFIFRYYRKTPAGRRRIDKLLLDIPVAGDVIRQIAAVRFAGGLSMLIKSGTPILHAMDIMIESAGNVIIMDLLSEVKESVRAGGTMAAPMMESAVFPQMLSYMISVGEESGELAGILEKAAIFYKERVDASVTRLTTLFEPVLIVTVGVIVGVLVVAMYLPIFGLSSAIAK